MRELDGVELLVDLLHDGLRAGDTGTIVLECQGDYIVEFFDEAGDTIAVADVFPA